jgi:hypothetical protein
LDFSLCIHLKSKANHERGGNRKEMMNPLSGNQAALSTEKNTDGTLKNIRTFINFLSMSAW